MFTAGSSQDEDPGGKRKRRTRNKEQMEHNKINQQKYRQRKKIENVELQHAVDLLTAEVAALKVLEVRCDSGLLNHLQIRHSYSILVGQQSGV